jgi:phospholipase A-2-activating protein
LLHHYHQVRGITVCAGDRGIATSSRDKTVRLWTQENRKFVSSKVLVGHTSFVGPITWIPPNPDLPHGGVASGGMDTLVLVWDLNTGEKVQTLKGHQLQVTGIAFDDGDLVSSSIDR